VKWRKSIETRFVFNPNEPISQGDISAVKLAIANKKSGLEAKLRDAVTRLQQTSALAVDQRKALLASANAAFARLKQAEAEERVAHPILIRVAKIVSAACVVMALVNIERTAKTATIPSGTVQPSQRATLPKPPEKKVAQQPSPQHTTLWPIPSPAPNGAPRIPEQVNTGSLPSSEPEKVITSSVPTEPPRPFALPDPLDNNLGGPNLAANGKPTLDLTRPPDVANIQKRLAELGYLAAMPDGKWGPRSARALQDFRSANQISPDGAWDRIVEERLFSAEAKKAPVPAFVGGWSTEPGQCGAPGTVPPVRITPTQAETNGGRCLFRSVRIEAEDTWRVAAQCIVGAETWDANIQLKVSGNTLTWSSQ
jgi:peptidoglycan hydrolase-like protein with peptidoglycan-binding domain